MRLRQARDRAMDGDWAAAVQLRSRRLAVLGIAAGHVPQWVG
ncbi:hypothetical protein ACFY36_08300 [Actinoplanes sp. NPDC000266]